MTKGWKELKKAEQEILEMVTFEQDSLVFLNQYSKTEVKIVKLPTTLRDKVSKFAHLVGSKDANNSGHRCSVTGDTHKVEIFKKDNSQADIYILKTDGKKILSIEKKEVI